MKHVVHVHREVLVVADGKDEISVDEVKCPEINTPSGRRLTKDCKNRQLFGRHWFDPIAQAELNKSFLK